MSKLGNGFDSALRKEKPLSIFSSSASSRKEPYIKFDFSSFVYHNTEDYIRQLSANSTFSSLFTAGGAASLNAAMEFSNDLSRNQDDLIYVINILGVRQSDTVTLNEEKFEQDLKLQNARVLLNENPNEFWEKYGDSYISQVLYGRSVVIVIKFKKAVAEEIKKREIKLDAKIENVATLKEAVKFLKGLSKNDLKCEIYIQSKGFTPEQLPPSEPIDFSELADWLNEFEENFSKINPSEVNMPVGFEYESYGSIFPTEAKPMLEYAELRGRYMLALSRSQQAVDYYINYYKWLGNYHKANEFHLIKDELFIIKQTLERYSKTSDPAVIDALEKLREINKGLKATKLEGKLINKFNSSELSGNITDGDIRTIQRVSPSFQLPELPPGDNASFTFKINNSKPIKGDLSFHYSLHKNVPPNSGSHRIASEILPNTIKQVEVPQIVKEKQDDLYFAYQYKTIESGWESVRQHFSSHDEVFDVETYLVGKKPVGALPLKSL